MPLLRELEFRSLPVDNKKKKAAGMHEMVVQNGKSLLYVDAAYTLGVQSFYAPVQAEIMNLQEVDHTSMLRFAPISLHPQLEKNANLILGLTGMDQVNIIFAACMNAFVLLQFLLKHPTFVSLALFLL